MANRTRLKKYAEIAKTKVAADFALGSVIEWGAEGVGPLFWLISRTADTTQTLSPGITVVTQNYKYTPAIDIFQAYFQGLGLPPGYFDLATMRFTDTTVQIWRNVEE
jgi:hypothetical protein